MKFKNMGLFLLIAVMALTCLASCGGGGDDEPGDTTNPIIGNPGGGDEQVDEILGVPVGQFTIAGGFGDVRGVAASQEYVYIGTATTLYAFDKNGNFVNQVASPATIQAVGVFPPKAEVDLPTDYDYFLAGFPIILHDPVDTVGFLRIFGPNLDTMTTVEDGSHADESKFLTLPGGQIVPPLPEAWLVCTAVYDMDIDRFGSVLVTGDLDATCTTPLDGPKSLMILNVFNDFQLEYGGPNLCPDTLLPPQAFTGFYRGHGWASGLQGTLGIDTLFPYNRTEMRYTWYAGHFNLLRDFVGVSFIELSPTTLMYTTGAAIDNNFGYNRVIGESVGTAPGSFNQNPPVFDGALEDPDLTNGGPSGMGFDPLTDNVYICDPGNRRIQVFDQVTGDYLFQIGSGVRGRSGNYFRAPSEVCVDLEGNVFVADVNDVRLIQASYSDRQFGNVGGTVYNGQLRNVLEGASVTLGNDLGALAMRTTNINGDYLIQNLLVGTYHLNAAKANYDTDTASITILSDMTVRADFNLYPNSPATVGAYTGSVIDDYTNMFVSDVEVLIIGTSITTRTDDIGRFQLNSILPGSYQVQFTHEDYETITRDLEIFAGQTTDDPNIKMTQI